MAECRLRSRLRGGARNSGPSMTAGPVPLITPQWCTNRPGMKSVQASAFPFRASNCPCTNGFPSENCRNRGPTRAPTAPRLTINVSENIEEAQEAAPNLCWSIPLVVFHQDAPTLLPGVLPRGYEWPALQTRADTAHAAPALTETPAPNPAASAAVRSGKINSNCA